jgi:hypothetical protein
MSNSKALKIEISVVGRMKEQFAATNEEVLGFNPCCAPYLYAVWKFLSNVDW